MMTSVLAQDVVATSPMTARGSIRRRYFESGFCVLFLLCGISSCAPSKPTPEQEQKIIAWLKRSHAFIYAQRGPERAGPVDIEGWIREGEGMRGSRLILEDFLRRKDSRVHLPPVAFALGEFGNAHTVPLLIQVMEDQEAGAKQWGVRRQAARALGKLRDKRATAVLCQAVANEEDPILRANAIRALGQLGGEEAQRSLESVVDDENTYVARAARMALRELRDRDPPRH